MPIGRIVRSIGGFLTVAPMTKLDQSVPCAIRGRLKLGDSGFLVGDKVEYQLEQGQGVITKILPRQNLMKRPYIANVDLILLVFAHQNPDPNQHLISKLTILAEASDIPYRIIFNKSDLIPKGNANKLANSYRDYGYEVLSTSTLTHQGKRTLQSLLSGKTTVFAGPSGVGKSALLNMLAPGLSLKTGILSEKIGRGKHTTREVQLLPINRNTYAADTPGFSQVDLDFLAPQELAQLFPDFRAHLDKCRFSTCIHHAEPECAIKEAVTGGAVKPERYQLYLDLLTEVKHNWENRYR